MEFSAGGAEPTVWQGDVMENVRTASVAKAIWGPIRCVSKPQFLSVKLKVMRFKVAKFEPTQQLGCKLLKMSSFSFSRNPTAFIFSGTP